MDQNFIDRNLCGALVRTDFICVYLPKFVIFKMALFYIYIIDVYLIGWIACTLFYVICVRICELLFTYWAECSRSIKLTALLPNRSIKLTALLLIRAVN